RGAEQRSARRSHDRALGLWQALRHPTGLWRAETTSAGRPRPAGCPRDTWRGSKKHHLYFGARVQAANVERDFEHAIGANEGEDQVRLAEHRYGRTIFEPNLDVVLAAGRRGDVPG